MKSNIANILNRLTVPFGARADQPRIVLATDDPIAVAAGKAAAQVFYWGPDRAFLLSVETVTEPAPGEPEAILSLSAYRQPAAGAATKLVDVLQVGMHPEIAGARAVTVTLGSPAPGTVTTVTGGDEVVIRTGDPAGNSGYMRVHDEDGFGFYNRPAFFTGDVTTEGRVTAQTMAVAGPATLGGRPLLTGPAGAFGREHWQTLTVNTDANGVATVAHSGGFTPAGVMVMQNGSATAAAPLHCIYVTGSATGASVQLRFWSATGTPAANTSVAITLILVA